MLCPYCNKEMRDGYIQGARGVIFSEDVKLFFVTKNPFSKKDVTVAGMWEGPSPAHYCDLCECLIWKKNEE